MGSLIVINPSCRPFCFNLSNHKSSSFSFKNFKRKFQSSSSFASIKCSKFQNSSSPWGPYRPFSILLPIIQRFKTFARKTSNNTWVSALRGCPSLETLPVEDVLQNGTFGMALLSVTTTAKVKMSPIVATLAANPTFVSGLFAWFIAQSMKVFLNFCLERKWDFRLMCASGGMPSSHSALCTALTTSVAICHGVADSLFPVCLGFSLIVMYDAIGVRRHAGMQAEVLNMIVADLFQGHPISQRKLKELLGHTPSQVLAGALLGIMVAWICCVMVV